MLLTTKGIVLSCLDYSETSIIVRVYTEQLGLQSYIVKGVRKKGARIKRNLFSPLSIIQLVANHKEGDGLRIIREVSCLHHLNSIATDMSKTAVCIFMSELLSHSFSAQMADPVHYQFLEESILYLNQSTESIPEFPLAFMLKLAQFLGLEPHNNFSGSNIHFDMIGGNFSSHPPAHAYYFSLPLSEKFSQALTASESGYISGIHDYRTRTELLTKMLTYYRLHIPSFGELKSVQVLTDVFRD